jgi:hypothetical protein
MFFGRKAGHSSGCRGPSAWVAAGAVVLLSASCGSAGSSASSGSAVRDLADKMAQAGVECVELTVEEGASGEGTIMGMDSDAPRATEIGYCVLENAPEIQGRKVASRILTFEDGSHVKYLKAQYAGSPFPVVYGETWQIHVEPPERALEVRQALDAKMI